MSSLPGECSPWLLFDLAFLVLYGMVHNGFLSGSDLVIAATYSLGRAMISCSAGSRNTQNADLAAFSLGWPVPLAILPSPASATRLSTLTRMNWYHPALAPPAHRPASWARPTRYHGNASNHHLRAVNLTPTRNCVLRHRNPSTLSRRL